MKFITHLGDAISIIIICLILIAIPFLRKNYSVRVILSVISASILNSILKLTFARERPNILQLITEKSYSFPSGHSMANMALYASIVFISWKKLKNIDTKIFITTISSILVIIIGISRVYLGVHYITDVLAGWAFGLIIAYLVCRKA